MKIGIGHAVCPHCDAVLHNHAPLTGKKKPVDEDISFCASCGKVSMFMDGELFPIKLFKNLEENIKKQIKELEEKWKLSDSKDANHAKPEEVRK